MDAEQALELLFRNDGGDGYESSDSSGEEDAAMVAHDEELMDAELAIAEEDNAIAAGGDDDTADQSADRVTEPSEGEESESEREREPRQPVRGRGGQRGHGGRGTAVGVAARAGRGGRRGRRGAVAARGLGRAAAHADANLFGGADGAAVAADAVGAGAQPPIGRGRGVRGGRGRGRGRGRGGGNVNFSEWENEDVDIHVEEFTPHREQGLHLPENFNAVNELSFFSLFFTAAVISNLVDFTNLYADMHILSKPSYATGDGEWELTNAGEMKSFIAVLIYFGLVRVADADKYWSRRTLYSGLWARRMLSRLRFRALRAFFHCSQPLDPTAPIPNDRLARVRYLYDHLRNCCPQYWQPGAQISIDERMVRFKGRQVMKVYIKNKPVKWGFKSFTLCDSATAYNCHFELYTGQQLEHSEYGLTHDLVMRLVDLYLDQHYQLFTDNYYTSHTLATSLLHRNTYLVGTVRSNRQGFPDRLKQVAAFQRHGQRGDMRYERVGEIVYVQWLDKRSVTVLSTMHRATSSVVVTHKVRNDEGNWVDRDFPKPAAVDFYNRNMGGVDVFDQLASSYRLLRRSKKFTKILFADMLEISVINSYKLFQAYRSSHPDVLQRQQRYSQCEFRENLIRQLCEIGDDEVPPGYVRGLQQPAAHATSLYNPHVAINNGGSANCAVCWARERVRRKTVFACDVCRNREGNRVHLCITADRQCFKYFHSHAFDRFR